MTQLWCGAQCVRGGYAEGKFSFRVLAPRCNGAVVMGIARDYTCPAVQNVGWLMIPSSCECEEDAYGYQDEGHRTD